MTLATLSAALEAFRLRAGGELAPDDDGDVEDDADWAKVAALAVTGLTASEDVGDVF